MVSYIFDEGDTGKEVVMEKYHRTPHDLTVLSFFFFFFFLVVVVVVVINILPLFLHFKILNEVSHNTLQYFAHYNTL